MSKEKEYNAPHKYTRKQLFKFAVNRFKDGVIRPFRIFFALRPSNVERYFKHIYAFAPADKVIAGYKHAIHYGVLYFLQSTYDSHNCIDLKDRGKKVDGIIEKYSHPTDRLDYLDLLQEAKNGMLKANSMGLIGSANDKINKIEAANYNSAMDSLDIAIRATALYPKIWKRVFAPQP